MMLSLSNVMYARLQFLAADIDEKLMKVQVTLVPLKTLTYILSLWLRLFILLSQARVTLNMSENMWLIKR
jgi:hypothetical protein